MVDTQMWVAVGGALLLEVRGLLMFILTRRKNTFVLSRASYPTSYGTRSLKTWHITREYMIGWMGGTMDDVRRDMVELGKVLNVRKEEGK